MIYLEFSMEQPIFNKMIINPKAIKALPEETYNKFYKFMLQEELYEDIHKLESIKDRLISKTLNDCVEDVMNKSDWIEL
jgi:hypothetical protein